ncbi:MetQ/NlpA family ABC transporter substrate-binding protein [Erysipelothrix urinaevulpis]|uniref:MetQ/NlpA family ABC transporter substrate-binding protein n=1 Tax=Erysipelothrix urinaevulpis TaxID=2683717 RepID=UPI0013594E93|nr:MetQ/NlpA family ABC transporter substrate-binding protein [Erysipelothrix urinaevulpis]
MKKILSVFLVLLIVSGCGAKKGDDDKIIKVTATALPHAEILKQVVEPLKNEGYTLEINVVDDYKIPNTLLDDGTIDANYFQHIPYLSDFNKQANSDLQWALKVHYEPIAIYAGKKDTLDAVKEGDTVLVPDDPTNLPRALSLLEELGWIELTGEKLRLKDIAVNHYNLDIKEIQADNITPLIDDADYAIINGNYALAADITQRGLQAESISQEKVDEIVNVIAVRKDDLESDKTKALIKAFSDPKVKTFIEEKYAPSVISTLD